MNRKQVFSFISIVLLGSLAITQQYPEILKNKTMIAQIQPALNLIKKTVSGDHNSDVDERFEINQASIHLIKESPLIGYGIGDVQNVLNNYYSNHLETSDAFKLILDKQLNSHNNYAFLWLSAGIICFFLLLLSLGYFFYLSISNQNWLFFFFLIIISLNMLTENILSRINGVLFFSLFTGIFLISSKQIRATWISKKNTN